MKVYVTGDTHLWYNLEKLFPENFTEGQILTKDDYLIICGDTGLTWDDSERVQKCVEWLNAQPWTTLVVDGNHENFDVLNSLPVEEWNGGKVHFIADSIIHLMRGQVFNINDIKIFTMGGATSIDKSIRVEHISWWKEEEPSYFEEEEGFDNLEKNNWEVDYVITHDAPSNVLYSINPFFQSTSINRYLFEIEKKLKFKSWYFGHHHMDKNVDSKHRVCFNEVVRIV